MAQYIPFNYDKLNLIEGTYSPSTAKHYDNESFWYWCRCLFQRLQSVIKFNNLPDNWDANTIDFFYYCLLRFGFVAVFNNDRFGLSFQPCALTGFDFYYQPTNAIVTNPLLTGVNEFKIHEDCELIKLAPDYFGMWDVVEYYAIKLSELSCATDMAIENSKLAYVFAGRTKSAIASIKKIFDKISKGETTVVFDSRVASEDDIEPYHWLTREVKNSYITDDILENVQTILRMFDNEIGIPSVPYQKKERMVEFESKSAIVDATSRLTVILETLENSLANVNRLFNTNISVEPRFNVDDFVSESVGGGKVE